MMAEVEEAHVVVAHRERATLRVGDVFVLRTPRGQPAASTRSAAEAGGLF